jgi:hypothetical protein
MGLAPLSLPVPHPSLAPNPHLWLDSKQRLLARLGGIVV